MLPALHQPVSPFAAPSDADLAVLYSAHLTELARRYAPVLAEAGYDAVLIHSGSLKKRTEFDDQYWPLRPTPHFQHWLPLGQADCALLIEPGVTPTLFWPKAVSYWERPSLPERDHWQGAFATERLDKPDDLKDLLSAKGLGAKRMAYVGEDKARASTWGFDDAAHINPFDLVGRLDRLRVYKTPYEVACIAEANRRAAIGHDAVLAAFRAGVHSELALHLRYLEATQQDDPETPYKNIVALGRNGATLHHVSYEKQARARTVDSLLLDAGATFLGYTSDITRTWVRGEGATASAFAQLIAGVEAMQLRLCADVAVGKGFETLHEDTHRQVGDILRETGLVRMSTAEMIEHKLTHSFFPHGLGHSLGLQCHDVGCALVKPKPENPYLRNTSIIEPGQVFTIEPGIYFIDFLMDELRQGPHAGAVDWPLADALAELGGVRIEDDLHVTGGPEVLQNLTRGLLPSGGGY